MAIKAIIFDRDGVLTHFAVVEAVAFFQPLVPLPLAEIGNKWKQWGETVGFPHNVTEGKHFSQGFWQMLSEELGLSAQAREQLLRMDYLTFLRPFADARPALLDVALLALGA